MSLLFHEIFPKIKKPSRKIIKSFARNLLVIVFVSAKKSEGSYLLMVKKVRAVTVCIFV